MRAIRSMTKLVFALFLLLTACGQRGPLFLPDKSSTQPSSQQPETEDEQQPEDQDDTGA
jgi:predicted small lipoprotein YifL